MQDNVYVIVLDDEYLRTVASDDKAPDTLYRVKGFNSLVFDAQGLDKLTPLDEYLAKTKSTETEIDAAREGGWQLAKKIVFDSEVHDLVRYGLLEEDVLEMSDLDQDRKICSIFTRFTCAEAKAKIDAAPPEEYKTAPEFYEGDVIWNAAICQYGIVINHLRGRWFTVELLDAVKSTGAIKPKTKDYDVWDAEDCALFSKRDCIFDIDTQGWIPGGK